MKKFLSMACALMLGATVQAQIVTSTSRSITREKAPSTTTNYVRLGLNIMNVAGDGAEDLGSKMGYDFSYGFQKTLGGKGAYWGMEAGLSSRGYGYSEKESYNGYQVKYELNFIAHNIYYVPFQFGWKFNVGRGFTIDPHVGIFASFDYAGKEKEKFTEDGESYSESYSLGDLDGYRRFDVGLKFGVGAWYKNFNLDLAYQRGFVSAWEDGDMFTSNFQIRLGYAF